MIRNLTREEKDMIFIALSMRENYIETGNISTDAASLQKMGEHKPHGAEIKALSVDQMKLLIASKELKTKILQDKVNIDDV